MSGNPSIDKEIAKKALSFTGSVRPSSYESSKSISSTKLKPFSLDAGSLSRAFENATFVVEHASQKLAVSWWVSAKRTRSYPYARVYDTLSFLGKKVTIVPFVKDEGIKGDRDFLQYDSISFMSHLGVYVIVGYYTDAERNLRMEGKITNQRHDSEYILERLTEVIETTLTPHEWNLQEIIAYLPTVAARSAASYEKISKKTGVRMHDLRNIDRRARELEEGIDSYKGSSRLYAEKAQLRESITVQPKENVKKASKGALVLTDSLGGKYFWTSDEVIEKNDRVFIIEKKHTRAGELPSLNDIKDGLLKSMLYSNIIDMKDGNGKDVVPIASLGLTSGASHGACWNYCNEYDKVGLSSGERYLNRTLKLSPANQKLLKNVFDEAKKNRILVYFLGKDSIGLDSKILELSDFGDIGN